MTQQYVTKTGLLFFLFFINLSFLFGQNFHLLKDINATSSSSPSNSGVASQGFAISDNTGFFSANDGVHGTELWKTDGTQAGTTIVKDVTPGFAGTYLFDIKAFGNKVVFTADDGLHGTEPWISDGTASGTFLLKDCTPGSFGSSPREYTQIGNNIFFVVNTNGYSADQLWISDGTPAGTRMVANLNTQQFDFTNGLFQLTAFSGKVFFTAYNGIYGNELWESDGTSEGTFMVKDIANGNNSSYPINLSVFGNYLYFSASAIETSPQTSNLWRTDGTAAGTEIANINTIPSFNISSLAPGFPFANFNNNLYFSASSNSGYELYKYNPDSRLIQLIKDIYPGSGSSTPSNIVTTDKLLYFTATTDSITRELWLSDGTTAGTKHLVTFDSIPQTDASLYILQNKLLFTVDNLQYGTEVWTSDGTSSGTVLVKDINPGVYSSLYLRLSTFRDKCLFAANDGMRGFELWQTDGTLNNTKIIKDINLSSTDNSSPTLSGKSHIITDKNKMIFGAQTNDYGREPWITDGTSSGTTLLKDLIPGFAFGLASPYFTQFQNKQYFIGLDRNTNPALWKTDGSTKGTTLIQTLDDKQKFSVYYPFDLAASSNNLFLFVENNNAAQSEIYTTNGTDSLHLIKDKIWRYSNYDPTAIGSTLFFVGTDSVYNSDELWKTDGTTSGTIKVKDIVPGSGGSDPSNLVVYNNKLFFRANAGTGYYLWKSDGTDAGTVILKKIETSITPFKQSGNWLYFTATTDSTGEELWKTNGLTNGTEQVKDIYKGNANAGIANLTDVNGTLFFTASDSIHGVELWKSDGTTQGTALVKDITPGTDSSVISNLVNANGLLYFVVNDKLWMSNGTEKGTLEVIDQTLSAISSLNQLTAVGTNLYFTAFSEKYGTEVYAGDANNILPVTLLHFTGTLHNQDAILQWATTNEVNNDHYDLQRSSDGINFKTIAELKSIGQNNIALNKYQYTDVDAATAGANNLYYRLQQIDKDGNKTTSKIVLINIPQLKIITINPNPVKNIMSIYSSVTLNKVSIFIQDMNGRTLLSTIKNLAAGERSSVNVNNLPAGIYSVHIKSPNGYIQNIKILIER